METDTERRAIRSFVIREGRMTPGQKRALEEAWPDYGLEVSGGQLNFDQLFAASAPIILEIGFGMGDSLFEMASGISVTNASRRGGRTTWDCDASSARQGLPSSL